MREQHFTQEMGSGIQDKERSPWESWTCPVSPQHGGQSPQQPLL